MTNDIVIKTEFLTKNYSEVKAVSDVNLNVRKGEIYGFLGLNGAGKTTTIRMLLGMINPSSGKSFILGKQVKKDNIEILKKIGFIIETPHSYQNLTVYENLEIIKRLRSINDKNAIPEVIERLQLGAYINRKAKNLSLGNAQRLGLAKALIHKPKILILDEPTNGLDPEGIHDIREMLSNMAKQNGVTIFISSHILGEISRFASRIGIIHEGKMIQEFNSEQLDSLCKKELLIKAKKIELAHKLLLKMGYKEMQMKDGVINIQDLEAINNPDKIATMMVNEDCPPTMLNVQEENLESYFLRTINSK